MLGLTRWGGVAGKNVKVKTRGKTRVKRSVLLIIREGVNILRSSFGHSVDGLG